MVTKPTIIEKTEHVPKGEWPGAWKLYQYSKQAVLINWQTILGLLAVSILISLMIEALFPKESNATNLLINLISVAFGVILTSAYLASSRGKSISFEESFSVLKPMLYLKYLAVTLISGLLSFLSLILFIVPFFFVFPRILMAPYLVVDKGTDPVEAIQASWNMTKEHVGKIWGIIGATLAMSLLALTIIGIPFALYFLFMYQVAMILLYRYIQKK